VTKSNEGATTRIEPASLSRGWHAGNGLVLYRPFPVRKACAVLTERGRCEVFAESWNRSAQAPSIVQSEPPSGVDAGRNAATIARLGGCLERRTVLFNVRRRAGAGAGRGFALRVGEGAFMTTTCENKSETLVRGLCRDGRGDGGGRALVLEPWPASQPVMYDEDEDELDDDDTFTDGDDFEEEEGVEEDDESFLEDDEEAVEGETPGDDEDDDDDEDF